MFFFFQNVSIGIVGLDQEFDILDENKTARYLSEIEGDEKRGSNRGVEAAQDDQPPLDPPSNAPADPRVSVAMDTE